ncbi:hypothetical protein DFS33DRAFT_1277544 [Desarmillaria ectypa]|nr:hypothetical protein DFS33DRAFT_1277544 [Desarmillaria ectypa]
MSLFPVASNPPTKLGIYRVLASRAVVRVSPLALGAMSIGDKWEPRVMGSMDKESSLKLLDPYFDMGGNLITANSYQDGTSEVLIGEWAEERGIRDQLVIVAKYTTDYERGNNAITQKVNYVGNTTTSYNMFLASTAKMAKLSTLQPDQLLL